MTKILKGNMTGKRSKTLLNYNLYVIEKVLKVHFYERINYRNFNFNMSASFKTQVYAQNSLKQTRNLKACRSKRF